MQELEKIEKLSENRKVKIGLRMAINEEPQSSYYTSRFGIRPVEMIDFYNSSIRGRKNIELKMFHFFVDSGIKDSLYYWGEFQKAMKLYVNLKKECKTLDSINLGAVSRSGIILVSNIITSI